jgi:hypothetical protein
LVWIGNSGQLSFASGITVLIRFSSVAGDAFEAEFTTRPLANQARSPIVDAPASGQFLVQALQGYKSHLAVRPNLITIGSDVLPPTIIVRGSVPLPSRLHKSATFAAR